VFFLAYALLLTLFFQKSKVLWKNRVQIERGFSRCFFHQQNLGKPIHQ
jgi:hypothetical protein